VDGTFLYNLALFLHIGGVLVFAVVMAIEGIALRGMRSAATGAEARTWMGLMSPLRWLGPTALLLILLPGLYLAANVDSPGGWIGIGLLGFLVILVLGVAVTGRRMMLVGPALGRAQGQLGPSELRLAHDGRLTGSFAVQAWLGLGVVWMMTLKPDAAGSLVVLAVAAAIGLAFAVFLSMRPEPVSRAQPGDAVSGPGR
jgi:hypothetical protein